MNIKREVDTINKKQCTKCANWYPETTDHFYTQKRKSGSIKLKPWCKTCEKNYSNNYRQKHKDERAKYHKQWIIQDNNRVTVNKRANVWREDNKDWKREYQLQYQRENKEKIQGYNNQHQSHEITNKEWENCLKYFNYSCAYCEIHQDDAKEEYNNYLHKEHVIHDGADDLSNCVPACKSCNSKKWVYSLEEWYRDGNSNYKKERLNKILIWIKEDYKKFLEI